LHLFTIYLPWAQNPAEINPVLYFICLWRLQQAKDRTYLGIRGGILEKGVIRAGGGQASWLLEFSDFLIFAEAFLGFVPLYETPPVAAHYRLLVLSHVEPSYSGIGC
jgi:hypothetical protein